MPLVATGSSSLRKGPDDEKSDELEQIRSVKTTAKRHAKSEAELLESSDKQFSGALKRDMLKKNGRIDYDKLRKEGYSDACWQSWSKPDSHSFFRSRFLLT